MNNLYIITGPAGVGKSTTSNLLASSLKKSVLIEGDDIYNQFIGGRISPYKENAPLELFWSNCFLLIDNYLKNGYDVVFNYIITKDNLKVLKEKFNNYNIKFTLLLTDEKTIIKRDNERPLDCRMGERSLILLKKFIDASFDKNNIIDTTNKKVNDVVNEILTNDRFYINKAL